MSVVLPRRGFLVLSLGTMAVALLPSRTFAAGALQSFDAPLMGTKFRIVIDSDDAKAAQTAAEAAFKRGAEINDVCSDYLVDSELLRLCREPAGTAVKVSPTLFETLSWARMFAERTDGLVDPTIGPLTKLWRASRRNGKLPEPEVLAKARAAVDWKALQIDAKERTVTLAKPDMRLDLGGFAKGYAADVMLAILRDRGFPRALVAAGGDVRVGDAPRHQPAGWTVAIRAEVQGEEKTFPLANAAVSTSGDLHQSVTIDGVAYSHIIDPATGLGLTRFIAATVIAAEGAISDGLDTACCIAGPEKALASLERWGGKAARILTHENGKTVSHLSPTFPRL